MGFPIEIVFAIFLSNYDALLNEMEYWVQQEKEKKFDKFSHLHSYSGDSKTGWAHRVKQRHGIKIVKLLNQYIPQNADILEIGPGQGYFAGPITSGNNRYDAIEPSRSFRRALQDLGFLVTEEAVPPIERPSCSYDLIHASMVIENLLHMHLTQVISQACEVT